MIDMETEKLELKVETVKKEKLGYGSSGLLKGIGIISIFAGLVVGLYFWQNTDNGTLSFAAFLACLIQGLMIICLCEVIERPTIISNNTRK